MKGLPAVNESTGNVSGVAELIFGKYVWAFEITSALLITAALGAMVLAHRERHRRSKPSQRQWSERRIRENRNVAGLPGARCLRPPQRGRHPGAAARRHARASCRSPGCSPRASRSPCPTRHIESEHDIEHEIEEGEDR